MPPFKEKRGVLSKTTGKDETDFLEFLKIKFTASLPVSPEELPNG
jgi:hypothetical protein